MISCAWLLDSVGEREVEAGMYPYRVHDIITI
jgi:hypothetical protein